MGSFSVPEVHQIFVGMPDQHQACNQRFMAKIGLINPCEGARQVIDRLLSG